MADLFTEEEQQLLEKALQIEKLYASPLLLTLFLMNNSKEFTVIAEKVGQNFSDSVSWLYRRTNE